MANRSEAEHWDDVFAGLKLGKPRYDTDLWLEKHERRLAASEEVPVIDLGCGYGCDTLYLTERGYRVIACDFSAEALKRIHEYVPEAETRQFDMTAGLPFGDGAAKVIVADLSLHYFRWTETVTIVREMARVLVQGGTLLARVNSIRDIHFGAGLGVEIEPHYYEHEGRRKRFFDEADLRGLFSGWSIEMLEETEMRRYGKPKSCWELAAAAP